MVYLLALASAMVYGASDFIGGMAARRANVIAVALISQITGVAVLMLVLPLLPRAEPVAMDYVWGAGAGVAGGIGVAMLYRALAVGTMAVVAPITAVAAVAIPVIVSVLLGERPARLAIAGIVLAIASIVLVSQEQRKEPAEGTAAARAGGLPAGVGLAIAAGIGIGFFFLFLARTGSQAGLWPLLAARLVGVALFGGLALAGRHSLRIGAGVIAITLLCGAVDMSANILYLIATRYGPLSSVVTLSSLYPASTVLLARVVLGERLSRWQMIGVVCALTAVLLIVGGGSAQ